MSFGRSFGLAAAMLMMVTVSVRNGNAEEKRPPNILFMLMDNVGQDWFGCYGSDEGQTPFIDRLAATGVRFRHFYVTPICSTTRHQLLTGRYPFRTGWKIHHDAAIYGGGYFDWNREITFARVLRDAGYATAIAGKWQINDLLEPRQKDALALHGFDEHCLWPEGPKGHPASLKRYWNPYVLFNGRRMQTAGKYGPDLFTEYLIDFMRRHRDVPFLAYYSMSLTHGPPTPTPRSQDENGPPRQLFADMVRYADLKVEQLVTALDDLGLRDNTLVFVATDNGSDVNLGGRVNGKPVQGGLYTLSETGLDVPLIVNCPALVPGRRVSDVLVDAADIFPTLVELAGAQSPDGVTIDGRSFASHLLGAPDRRQQRPWMFAQYNETRIARDDRYKLYSTGKLIDLRSDPTEQRDLAGSSDAAVVAARTKLQAVLKRPSS